MVAVNERSYQIGGKTVKRVLPGKVQGVPLKKRVNPTLDAKAVQEILGYQDSESVYQKARKGAKGGGFNAYVYAPGEGGGYSWQIKEGSGYGNMTIMFVEDEIREWQEAHPEIERDPASYTITTKEKQEVLEIAPQYTNEKGRVNRRKLYDVLTKSVEDGGAGWSRTHVKYGVMKQILDEQGMPALHDVKITRANVKRGPRKKPTTE